MTNAMSKRTAKKTLWKTDIREMKNAWQKLFCPVTHSRITCHFASSLSLSQNLRQSNLSALTSNSLTQTSLGYDFDCETKTACANPCILETGLNVIQDVSTLTTTRKAGISHSVPMSISATIAKPASLLRVQFCNPR